MAHGPPGEEQIRQLLERRAPARDHLELAAVEAQLVVRLDEQAAGDALEVEIGDAVVAQAVGGVGRNGEDLQAGLLAQDPERRVAVGRRDDGLVRVRGDLARRSPVELRG